MRARALDEYLSTTWLGPVEWVTETGSTNADLLEGAESGSPHGSVLICDHQTSGRGRRDRVWSDAPGAALLMSVLQRMPTGSASIGVAGAALGLAACEALRSMGFASVALKWPNDLVVATPTGQAKLAGVLAQSTVRGADATVVVGIGVNVRSDRLATLVTDRQAIAMSDLAETPDRVVLAASILEAFAMARPTNGSFWDRYRQVSATLGSDVVVTTDEGLIEGRAVDVTTEGALLVETSSGRVSVLVGDVESLRG